MSYLLFDIGGTNLRLATSSDNKTLENIEHVPTPSDAKAGVQAITTYAQKHLEKEMKAAAGGIPGPLNSEKTMVVNAPNLPGWNNYPITQELTDTLKVPVHLQNDASLAGLGEATFGAGQEQKIVVYLTISTGIGGTRIVNQKIDENSLGFEPGHHMIVPDGDTCTCGAKGHLESYVSGGGLKLKYNQEAKAIQDPQIWQSVEKYLAIGLNNVICFWSPDIVILGGSLMKSLSVEHITQELLILKPVFPTLPPIKNAELGDQSGLYGALAYLLSQNPI